MELNLRYKKRKLKGLKKVQLAGFAIIIGSAVISFWRGLWGLLDVYLYPQDYITSLWLSFFIGLIILILTGYLVEELI